MGTYIDMTGERFGKVTVQKIAGRTKGKAILWQCKCDCGKIIYETRGNLLSGNVKSCGCERVRRIAQLNRTHGESHKTRIYRIWLNMKNRCNNAAGQDYDNYGGRGITVCEEWERDYVTFRDWALANGYDDKLSLDRIDNDKGYGPNNCRWATAKQQASNRRPRRWAKKPKTIESATKEV